jgi:hypothetical protein
MSRRFRNLTTIALDDSSSRPSFISRTVPHRSTQTVRS